MAGFPPDKTEKTVKEDDPKLKLSTRDLSLKDSNSIDLFGNRDELRIASMAQEDDPKLKTSEEPHDEFDRLLLEEPFPCLSDFDTFDDWLEIFPSPEDHSAQTSTEFIKTKEIEAEGRMSTPSEGVKTCGASNKKNQNREIFPPPKQNKYRQHHLYPIQYEYIYRPENNQEPLVSYFGQNQFNQPMGGFVGLSEFQKVVQEEYFASPVSLQPNAPAPNAPDAEQP